MIRSRVAMSLAAASALVMVLSACVPDRNQVTPTAVPSGVPTNAPGGDIYEQEIQWETCGELECATIQVPLDWGNPGGETIDLKLNKIPAEGDKQGSLLLNPGGPGGSGLDLAEYFGAIAGDELLEAYDIIGFDPRGVGESSPVNCGDKDVVDTYIVTDWPLDTQEDVDAANQRNVEFAKVCEANTGRLIENIDTPSVARDMDLIRALVGDEKLNYLGFSYGTKLGATYAQLFPENVGRLVLDGATDFLLPEEEQAYGQAKGFEEALEAFIAWCLKEDGCPLERSITLAKKQIHELTTSAIDNPFPGQGIKVNGNLMVYGIVVTLYDEGSWPYLKTALIEVIETGSATIMGQLADFYLDRSSEDGDYLTNSTVAFTAINCLDAVPEEPWTIADVAEFREYMEEASPTFGWWFAASTGCSDWPFTASEHITTLDKATSVSPILVIGTTGDPATPYEWAESLTQRLGNATLLTYKGEGHTAYGRSNQCIIDAVDNWLVHGEMPDSGTVC